MVSWHWGGSRAHLADRYCPSLALHLLLPLCYEPEASLLATQVVASGAKDPPTAGAWHGIAVLSPTQALCAHRSEGKGLS